MLSVDIGGGGGGGGGGAGTAERGVVADGGCVGATGEGGTGGGGGGGAGDTGGEGGGGGTGDGGGDGICPGLAESSWGEIFGGEGGVFIWAIIASTSSALWGCGGGIWLRGDDTEV